jgi:hypothetical protein
MPEEYVLRPFELPVEKRVETRPRNPFGLSKEFSKALENSNLFNACPIVKLWDMHREASEKEGTEAILIRIEDRIVEIIQSESSAEKEITFGEVLQWLYDFPEIPRVKPGRTDSQRFQFMNSVQQSLFVLAGKRAKTTEDFVDLYLHGAEVRLREVSLKLYRKKAIKLMSTAKDKALLVKHGLIIQG